MAKLLVERPRTGRAMARYKRKGTVREALWSEREDAQTTHASMRSKKYRWWYKDLNENLAPFWRFIDGCVGRPWVKVYSEICEHVDRSSAVQAHILQHVWDRIERNPVFRDGKVYAIPRFSDEPKEIEHQSYYIDRIGILRRGKGLSYRQREALRKAGKDTPRYVALSPGRLAKQDRSGIWYEVIVAEKPRGVPVRDAWFNEEILADAANLFRWDTLTEYGEKLLYAVSKRAMNSREIARIAAQR
jgi:hypothetical protein